jgi:hypothetical protein
MDQIAEQGQRVGQTRYGRFRQPAARGQFLIAQRFVAGTKTGQHFEPPSQGGNEMAVVFMRLVRGSRGENGGRLRGGRRGLRRSAGRRIDGVIHRAVISFTQNETRSRETAASEGQTAIWMGGNPGCEIIV